MSVTEAATKPARRWGKYLLILVGALAAVAGALTLYINTESFQALVRRRLVAEVERITQEAAPKSAASAPTIPFRLQVEVRNITKVHVARESSTDVPLAHAENVVARLKISSLIRSELGFRQVILDQPLIHVIFYPDGTTNFPGRTSAFSAQAAIEQLFSLSITQLEVRQGRMLWDNRSIPLDFAAGNLSLEMEYSYLHARYHGHLRLGMVDTSLPDCRPFAWMSSVDFSLESDSAAFSSLEWNSGHSNLSASEKFRSPTFAVRASKPPTMPTSISAKRLPSPGVASFVPAFSNSKETATGHSTSSPLMVCSPCAISPGELEQGLFLPRHP